MKVNNNLSNIDHEPVTFSSEMMAKVSEVIASYPEGKHKSAIIRMLHLVQSEKGWVSTPSMDKVAEILNILPIEVYEVATFYTMFHLEPVGKYVFEVCHTGLEHFARHQQRQLADQNGGFSSRGHWRAHEDFLFPHATQQQFQRDALEDVVPARQKKNKKMA